MRPAGPFNMEEIANHGATAFYLSAAFAVIAERLITIFKK